MIPLIPEHEPQEVECIRVVRRQLHRPGEGQACFFVEAAVVPYLTQLKQDRWIVGLHLESVAQPSPRRVHFATPGFGGGHLADHAYVIGIVAQQDSKLVEGAPDVA